LTEAEKCVAERLRGDQCMKMIFSRETEKNLNHVMNKLSTELVSDPGEMLNILAESKANGTTVGVIAPVLGEEMHVTAVDDIIIDNDITIVLKNYDVTGYMLETNKLKLGEISCVCPFKSPFENPYMRTFRHSKSL
jgi:hypothetical protein